MNVDLARLKALSTNEMGMPEGWVRNKSVASVHVCLCVKEKDSVILGIDNFNSNSILELFKGQRLKRQNETTNNKNMNSNLFVTKLKAKFASLHDLNWKSKMANEISRERNSVWKMNFRNDQRKTLLCEV